jgi:cation diffusion facilitator family transporter
MSEFESSAAEAGKSVTLIGALVNALLVLLKFAAGIFGHSQALIADAVHSVSDLFTDAVVLIGLKMGRKAPDEQHHFGHARIETLSSAAVGVALLITAIYIGIEAGNNIYRHVENHPTPLALVAAGVSVALKEILYHMTVRIGRRIKSSAIVANAWHHRSDALSSVAVLIGVAVARIKPSWHILDAYAALFVSVLVIKVGLDILWSTLHEITDAAPRPEVLHKIGACAMSIDGVVEVHDLRVRTLGGLYQMEIHIVVDGKQTVLSGHRIAKAVEQCIAEDIEDADRIIVHVDPAPEETDSERSRQPQPTLIK